MVTQPQTQNMPLRLEDAVSPVLTHLLREFKCSQTTCVAMSMCESSAEIFVAVECATRNEELGTNNEDKLK